MRDSFHFPTRNLILNFYLQIGEYDTITQTNTLFSSLKHIKKMATIFKKKIPIFGMKIEDENPFTELICILGQKIDV